MKVLKIRKYSSSCSSSIGALCGAVAEAEAFALQPPVPAGDLHAWPCPALSCAGPQMHGTHEICCGLPRAREYPNGQRSGLRANREQASKDHALSCRFQPQYSTCVSRAGRLAKWALRRLLGWHAGELLDICCDVQP